MKSGPDCSGSCAGLELSPVDGDALRRVMRLNIAAWSSRLPGCQLALVHDVEVTRRCVRSD